LNATDTRPIGYMCGVERVTGCSEEQDENMTNNKCQWFTNAAVGIEVCNFAYKITYRD